MEKKQSKKQPLTLNSLIDFFEKSDKTIGNKVGIVFVSEYKEVAPDIKMPLLLFAEFELRPTNPMLRVTRKDIFNLLEAINKKHPILQIVFQRPVELEAPKEIKEAIKKYQDYRTEMIKKSKGQCSDCQGPCEHKK